MSRSRSRSPLRRSNGSLTGEYGRRDRGGGGDRTRSRIDQKSDRMVYLSNLPWELKWMELKDIIREKAGEVNFVEVLEERDGRSKGCAVVEFKHRDGANKCIENMHRTELRDRLIIAKEIRDPVAFFRKVKEDTGIDFLGGGDRLERNNRGNFDRGGAGGGGQVTINENETYGLSPNFLRQLGISTPLCNRVFLTNIPYNCSVGRLFDVCSLAGKVTWFDLQMDKDGKSKGMAVAEYSHPIEAVQAVSMLNNQRLFDRTLAVRLDRYPKDQERRDPNGLPFGLRAVGMGLGANGAPLTDVASVISSINPVTPSQQMMAMNGAASAPFAVVAAVPTPQMTGSWVTSGIPPAAAQPVIQPVHAPQGGYQQAAMQAADHGGHYQQSPAHQPNSFQPHGGGGGGGGGFFNAPAQQSAGQQHRPTPGIPQFGGGGSGGGGGGGSGAAMAAYAAPPKSAQASYVPTQAVAPQQYEAPVKYEMGGYGGYGSGSSAGNTGGAVQQSQGANAYDASRIILIKNLPQDYTWQIVSDRVQQFGDLESVEMITPGVAKVRFVQLKDAERAKQALQGTTVEGRAIGIEYL